MKFKTVKNLFQSGELDRTKCDMTFDWDKAAQIIKRERPYIAYSVLEDCWNTTRCKIYQGGFPVYEDYTVHSPRLRPMLILDSHDPVPCFKMECDTNGMEVWPQTALDILEGKK